MTNKCFVCDGVIDETSDEVSRVAEKGIASLIIASRERGDTMNLTSRLTQEEYKKFVDDGAFTMRRSDRFWSGVWSDMTIETKLMRSFSAQGGVKRGRGVSDSVISKWVVGISATYDV